MPDQTLKSDAELIRRILDDVEDNPAPDRHGIVDDYYISAIKVSVLRNIQKRLAAAYLAEIPQEVREAAIGIGAMIEQAPSVVEPGRVQYLNWLWTIARYCQPHLASLAGRESE